MPKKLTIAQKIKLIRVNLGWSQEQLANHIKRTVGTVSKYESGNAIPPGDVLEKIYFLKQKIKHVTVDF